MMRTTVRYKGFHCDWVVLRGGVSSRHSVLRFLFCIMSSCSSSRHPVSPLRLAIPSRLCVSSCIVSSCRLVCVEPWGGTILAGRPLCHLVISSSPLRRPASFVSSCDAWGGTICVSITCRRASCAVSLSHSLRLVPVRLRSSSFVVVGMGVSLRRACGEIELTKTAHFNALVISVSSCSCSCSCCVAMGIGPGRTGVRQGTGAGLFGRPFCRICPQVVSAN